MSGKNEKWVMFRNYMENELGITKEDIRGWIDDAVRQEVKNVVNRTFRAFDPEAEARSQIARRIDLMRHEIVQALAEKLVIHIKGDGGDA